MPKLIPRLSWLNRVLIEIILSISGFVAYYFNKVISNQEKRSLRDGIIKLFQSRYKNVHETNAFLRKNILRILVNLNRRRVRSEGLIYKGVTFPDFMGHEDINKPGTYVKTYIHGSTLMLPSNLTRAEYEHELNFGQSKRTFSRGNSCYVRDAIYTDINDLAQAFLFDITEVDAQKATMVFDTLLGDNSVTKVEITQIDKRNTSFRRFVVDTYGELSRLPPNARYKAYRVMDSRHNMMTVGWKHRFCNVTNGPVPYVETPHMRYESDGQEQNASHLGNQMASFFDSKFPNFSAGIKDMETIAGLDRLLGKYFNQIDFSRNLGGTSHYDLGDGSPGIGIWWQGGTGNIDNIPWYFLFPNASINGSRGVAIKLNHGMMIKWDGREIKHCTFHPGDVPRETTLFGAFVCARQALTKEYIDNPKKNNMPIADPMQVERYCAFLEHVIQEDTFPNSNEVVGV